MGQSIKKPGHEQKNQKAKDALKRCSEDARDKVDEQLHRMQQEIEALLSPFGEKLGAFTLGEYLKNEKDNWRLHRKLDYDCFNWTDALSTLSYDPKYKCRGRSYLYRALRVHKDFSVFLPKCPDIRALCDNVKFGEYSRTAVARELRRLAECGDITAITQFLTKLDNDEAKLKAQIWRQREALEGHGIKLLKKEEFLEDRIPTPDFTAESDGIPMVIEVKDRDCDFRAVGEVLSMVASLRRKEVDQVRGGIMARTFARSACYAAYGQPITMFKIDPAQETPVVDVVNAADMNWNALDRLVTI